MNRRRPTCFAFLLTVACLALASTSALAGDASDFAGDHSGERNFGRRVMSFMLQTRAFAKDGEIPSKYTCSGEDVSPALTWSGAPQDTKAFALIVDDPDAPSGTFTHWVVYDLPAGANQLPENVAKNEELDGGGRQGRNDFRHVGYGGPCPPPGKPHRYFFKLFALNAALNLPAGASRREVESSMRGHVIAQAEIMGKFAR